MTENKPLPVLITLHGSTVARCAQYDAEVEKKRGSVLCALARRLIALGADPDAPALVTRGETLCFVPMPLKAWAKLTVEEGENHTARFRAFRDYTSLERARSAWRCAPHTSITAPQVHP